jgi:hypothetical protein
VASRRVVGYCRLRLGATVRLIGLADAYTRTVRDVRASAYNYFLAAGLRVRPLRVARS